MNVTEPLKGWKTHLIVAGLVALGVWDDISGTACNLQGVDADTVKDSLLFGAISTVKLGIDRVGEKVVGALDSLKDRLPSGPE